MVRRSFTRQGLPLTLIKDGEPVTPLTQASVQGLIYADNLNVLADDQERCNEVFRAVCDDIRAEWFELHEVVDASLQVGLLGAHLDGERGCVRPTGKP